MLFQGIQEADRRKDEFLAMLGHELRNPLGADPQRRADPAAARPPTRLRSQARDMIDRQVAHMARLIDDLLDVSRITRGKIQLRKERLDLAALVRAARRGLPAAAWRPAG